MASLSSANDPPPPPPAAAEEGEQAVVKADGGGAAAEEPEEELSPEEIISQYKIMRNQIKEIATKMDELELDYNEHQLVLGSITDMKPDRTSYRLIGGVLVQQTIGEVLPAVQQHQAMLKQLLDTVSAQLAAKEKEAVAWKVKYKIQTQQEREMARHQATEQAAAGTSGGGKQQGVLA